MNLKFSPRVYTPVDFTKFKTQFSASDLANVVARPGGSFRLPIVTLSPIKTIGQGKTYVMLNGKTDFEAGAGAWGGTPYAKFVDGPGTVGMWFEPSQYGIATVGNYVMDFGIISDSSTKFSFHAEAGISVPSDYTAHNEDILQITMQNIPSHVIWGQITFSSGAPWQWIFASITALN